MFVELSLSALQQRIVWIEAQIVFERIKPFLLLPEIFGDETKHQMLGHNDSTIRMPFAGLYGLVLT